VIYENLFTFLIKMNYTRISIVILALMLAILPLSSMGGVSPTQQNPTAVSGSNNVVMAPDINVLHNVTIAPTTLPSYTYYYGTANTACNITSGDWTSIFANVFNDRSIISYNFSANTTEFLIIFDITYTGLNPFGMTYVHALSQEGNLSVAHERAAFWTVANKTSLIKGYTNWEALNHGGWPGFSWSRIKVLPINVTYEYTGIMVAVVLSVFVLYFVFNRRK
jgi:hypothetical protein